MYQQILKFSVLWLKWTQTMEMKQSQTFFHGTYSNVTLYLFLSKYIEVFQLLEICSILWLKNKKNENETKSEIFPWDTYLTLFSSGHIKVPQWLSKLKFLNFMTKMNPNHGNETKSDIFPRDLFKSDVIFHWS